MEVFNNSLKSPLAEFRACPCSCSARPDKAPAELGTDRAELAQDSSELKKTTTTTTTTQRGKSAKCAYWTFLYSAGKNGKKKGRLIMCPSFIFRYL